ncbi:hypothetical protein B0H10DRAFT_1959218 [Mycena sp. CBHHK59/15]|nr:hypothetical protein B0H10DRAFT_1959218 [Mycena sp. CBHHK59/15]
MTRGDGYPNPQVKFSMRQLGMPPLNNLRTTVMGTPLPSLCQLEIHRRRRPTKPDLDRIGEVRRDGSTQRGSVASHQNPLRCQSPPGSEKRMDSLGDSQLLGYRDVAHRFSGGVHNENDDKCAVQAKMRVNVGSLTEPKTTKSASLPSKLDAERILMGQTALQASLGPRTFPSYSAKRTAREVFPESDIHMPKFRRGFLWSSSPQNHISPAALYTETAPPLPSPPAHLLNEPVVQASLRAMKDHIKVETPFNVEYHLNQHFVRSVMTGLREGFWPFHDGEYKVELQVKGENFACDPADLATIL